MLVILYVLVIGTMVCESIDFSAEGYTALHRRHSIETIVSSRNELYRKERRVDYRNHVTISAIPVIECSTIHQSSRPKHSRSLRYYDGNGCHVP